MSRSRSVAAALAAAIGCALTTASASAAEPPSIANLHVAGGEASWHPVDNFQLGLDRPAGQPPASAVHYLVRDHAGEAVPARRIAGDVRVIGGIQVRSGPGLYRAEVWLEGPRGEAGPIATAGLRFDNVAPGPAHPIPPGDWIAARSPAVVRVGHPAGPLPISGIRGYAISVDRGTDRAPCAEATRCTVAETDLGGGIDDDTISFGPLARGPELRPSRRGIRFRDAIGNREKARRCGWTRPTPRSCCEALQLAGPLTPCGSPRPPPTPSPAWRPQRPAGPYTAIAVDGRAPAMAAGDSTSATAIGDGAHRVAFYARDAAGNVADGEAGAPAPSHAIVRIDETEPQVAFSRAQSPAEPGADRRPPSPMRSPAPTRLAGRSRSARPVRASRSRSCQPRPRTKGWSLTGTRIAIPRGIRIQGYGLRRCGQLRPWRSPLRWGPDGPFEPAQGNDRASLRVRRRPSGLAPLLSQSGCSALPPRGDRGLRTAARGPHGALRSRHRLRWLSSSSGAPLGDLPGHRDRDLPRRRRPGAPRDRRADPAQWHLPRPPGSRPKSTGAMPPSPATGSFPGRVDVQPGSASAPRSACAPPRRRRGSAARRSRSAAGSPISAPPSPRVGCRSSCSSGSPARTGASSAPSRPTPPAASATPTRSPTTTAGASASSSAPSSLTTDGWPYRAGGLPAGVRHRSLRHKKDRPGENRGGRRAAAGKRPTSVRPVGP